VTPEPEEPVLSAEPDRKEVLRLLGMHRCRGASGEVLRRLDELWSEGVSSLRPRVWEVEVPIREVGRSGVTVGDGVFLRSHRLARALEGAECAKVFVATVGHGPDRLIQRWTARGRVADAFFLDAFASAAVESLVERYYRSAAEVAAGQGLGVTLRFSPGYCDWPVQDQPSLFSLFRNADLGVSLTESCFMTPRKSVSGVFGLAPAAPGRVGPPPAYNPCVDCGKHDCTARRATTATPDPPAPQPEGAGL